MINIFWKFRQPYVLQIVDVYCNGQRPLVMTIIMMTNIMMIMMIIVKAWCLGSPVWPLIAVASNFASTSPPSLPIPNYILSRPERKYSTFAWNKTSLHFPFPIQRQSYFVFIWIGLDCMEWCWGWRLFRFFLSPQPLSSTPYRLQSQLSGSDFSIFSNF